jgi:HEPN domain-containing protein
LERNNAKISYWIDLAEYDLDTAAVMLKSKRFLYVGFMCHQAVEKILKAYHVAAKGENPPYIHQLLKLARISGIYEEMGAGHKDTIDILDPLNVEARYPSQKDEILKSLDRKRCLEILQWTKELYSWIKLALSK